MSVSLAGARVALYVDPPSHHFLADRLFDPAADPLTGEDILAPYRVVRERLEARGVPVHTADLAPHGPGELRLYVSLGPWSRIGDPTLVPSALFALECPVAEPRLYRALPRLEKRFRRLFTISGPDALLPYTRRPVTSRPFRFPQPNAGVDAKAWERRDRRFLAMVNANKLPRATAGELYSERRKAVAHFAAFGEIDLYGKFWSDAPRRVGWTPVPATLRRLGERLWRLRQRLRPDPVWAACAAADRGPVRSKLATLAGYRFALCYENSALQGLITEKIFDCFAAGTVPVYLGAPDIADWIPEDCFVDRRRFADDAALRRHLHALSPEAIEACRERGRAFFASARFAPFRVEALAELLERIVDEDATAGQDRPAGAPASVSR